MFDTYRRARDVVEHVDSEVPGTTRWVLMNLYNDTLEATPQKAAAVSAKNLDAAVGARAEIVEALVKHMPAAGRTGKTS